MKTLKKSGKAIAFTLAALLALSGCGSKSANEDVNITSGTNGEQIVEKPTEISIFAQPTSGLEVKYEETPVLKRVAELTNVSVKQVNGKNVSSVQEAFSLMMSTGDLPDLVFYISPGDINKYGAEGAFAPLNDLLSQHAPNYTQYLKDHPILERAIKTDDGTIYGLMGYAPDGVKSTMSWIVRQDWLDKFGLAKPTSVDELYNILVTFRDGDPNGNGQKDEIGYFCRLSNTQAMMPLLALWNARDDFYIDENNKVKFGAIEDEFKVAYTNISKWYKEGLIDKEIFTRGSKARDLVYGQDNGGLTHDWFSSTFSYNNRMKELIPDFKLVSFYPPAGKEMFHRGTVDSNPVAAISAQSNKKEIAMRWIDFWYSETGARLANFGIEGEHYDMIDGKPTFKEHILNNAETVQNQLYKVGGLPGFIFPVTFEVEKQTYSEETAKAVEDYEKNVEFDEAALPLMNLTSDEQKEITSIMTDVNTYVTENSQKWVLGAADCEANFEKYVSDIKAMGIDNAIDIYQKAYDRYLKN